jgi:trans-aconitate methyltransferase
MKDGAMTRPGDRAAASAQTWNPEVYARNARFVSDLGQPVLELLAPRPGERILDLGCGDGALTRKLVELGCDVVGVDASPAQIDAARALGLDARVGDGHTLDFDHEFDAVFSNAALHWMRDAPRMIAGVYRALRPGGRFIAECGGHGCVDTIHRALIEGLDARGHDGEAASPWYFATPDDYGQKLAAAGFEVGYIALIERPTPLPGDILGWLETFAQSFTRVLPESEREGYLHEVRARIQPALCDASGAWTADYVRLRFAAKKAASTDQSPRDR